MPCGCNEPCNCCIDDTATISWTGSGAALDCYQGTVILQANGGLYADADGLGILLDPASPAALSTGPAGLSVACCTTSPADPDLVTFEATDTFEKADYPGIRAVKVRVMGGGGGSGGTEATGVGENASAGSGGGGGYSERIILASALAASEVVTIGAGGTAAAAGNNDGGTGGTSSFGVFMTGVGGTGGTGGPTTAGNAASTGGSGGVGTGGDINITGSDGSVGQVLSGIRVRTGGGGASQLAGRSGASSAGPAVAGQLYGGGARGAFADASSAAQAGAAGAAGVVVVEVI